MCLLSESAAKLVFFICLCKLFVEILLESATNTLLGQDRRARLSSHK